MQDSSQEPTPYRDRRFSWRKPSYSPLLERRAMVLPFLDNLNLKYIDDSSLEPTPTTEEFRFLPSHQSHQAAIPSHLTREACRIDWQPEVRNTILGRVRAKKSAKSRHAWFKSVGAYSLPVYSHCEVSSNSGSARSLSEKGKRS
jgi:hypothetical protein